MAGLGRRTHYRKHLTDSILHDLPEPNFDGGERVGKVVNTRGGNQFDVVVFDGHDNDDDVVGLGQGGDGDSGSGGTTANTVEDENQSGPDQHARRPPASPAESAAAEKLPLHPQLAILPTKFHKLVWVKRGDFVIVQMGISSKTNIAAAPAATPANSGSIGSSCDDYHDQMESEKDVDQTSSSTTPSAVTNDDDVGNGIRLMITHILYKDQVKHLKSKGLWPEHPEFVSGTDVDALEGDEAEQQQQQQQQQKDSYDDGIVYNDYFNNDSSPNENGEYDDGNEYYGYDEYDNSNDDDLFVNTNRLARLEVQDSGSDSDSSDDDE